MTGVLIGFAIIGTVIAIGYITGRAGVLGEHSAHVLSRIAFFVLSPCLLFTILADAQVEVLFSSLLIVSLVSAAVVGVAFACVARLLWKRELSETMIGSLAASYVNANNIGIPVSIYVIGDAAFSAPVILLQLLVIAPIALTILDLQERGRSSIGRILLQPFRNPIIVGSALGVLLSVTQIELPDPVMEPFRLIGAAAVPIMLLNFGMSLHGQRPLAADTSRRDVVLASALKLILMPLVAWAFGRFVVGLSPELLYGVVVLAALPTAQNVFTYALRYQRGQIVARDSILITTVLSVPVLLVAALLLAPG